MFSGLEWDVRSNNHLFMPQRPLGDRWQYLRGVRAELEPPPADQRTAELARWLDRPDRRLNIDAVRAVLWQLCRAGHRVRLRYGDPIEGRERYAADVCRDAHLARPSFWIPVRLYETDIPLAEAER
jgi:hypothetical protein